jgi:hypothetical protein
VGSCLAEPTVLVRQVVWSSSGSYHLEGAIWHQFESITLAWDVNCPFWEGGSSRWLWFLVIKMLSVLFFLESKVICKVTVKRVA